MRKSALLASTFLTLATAAQAQSLQTGNIGGMPYYLLPASGGCSAATPCSVITYLGVQSESAGAIANDVSNYFGGAIGPHTIVIAPQENGTQDGTTNWGGYNTATTPEQAQMVAVVQGVEAQMGNTVNPAASVVTGGSLGGTGTQAALISYGPKGQVQPGVFSAGVSFDASDWSAANDPSQIAALCGVPLTAVHGTNDTNQNISYDQNLASAINGNSACGNSFNLVPIQGAGHGTWGGPSGYQAGTGPGTPLGTIAADLSGAPTTATGSAQVALVGPITPATPAAKTVAATPALTPGKGSVTDCNGTVWTVSADGHVMQGSTVVPGGGDTSAVQLVGCTVYGQDNGDDPSRANAGGWFTLGGGGWTASAAPTAASASPAAPAVATAAVAPAVSVCGSGVPSGTFKVVNGRIIGPDGKDFIARGINLYDSQLGDIDNIIAMFPGINYLRVSVGHDGYHDPSYYQAFIAKATSAGRVVELEDHPDAGGGQDTSPPQGLAAESAWYASIAQAFANNPYVFFGTFNEPGASDQLSAWQKATYQAIRGAGNNNPILLEISGWPGDWTNALDPSVYATMHNTIWDPHFYPWIPRDSTDQTTVNQALADQISGVQQIPNADGTMAVIIAEYGDSDNDTPDGGPSGMAVVDAVVNSGGTGKYGSAAWAWNPGGSQDRLQNNGTMTSPYGQAVALYINTSVMACSASETASNAQAAIVAIQNQANPTAAPTTAPAAGIVETPDTTASTPPPALTDPATVAAISQADTLLAGVRALTGANQ